MPQLGYQHSMAYLYAYDRLGRLTAAHYRHLDWNASILTASSGTVGSKENPFWTGDSYEAGSNWLEAVNVSVANGHFTAEYAKNGFNEFATSNWTGVLGAPFDPLSSSLKSLQITGGRYLPSEGGQSALQKTGEIWKSVSFTKNTGITVKLSASAINRARQLTKFTSTALNILNAGFVADRLIHDKQYRQSGEGYVDIVMAGVAFVPGWGWAVAGTYSLTKLVLEKTGNDFWNH